MTTRQTKLKGKYSEMERALLALLSTKPKTTSELADSLYNGNYRPRNAAGSVVSVLRILQDKVKDREAFVVENTKRRGPYPMSFWLRRK